MILIEVNPWSRAPIWRIQPNRTPQDHSYNLGVRLLGLALGSWSSGPGTEVELWHRQPNSSTNSDQSVSTCATSLRVACNGAFARDRRTLQHVQTLRTFDKVACASTIKTNFWIDYLDFMQQPAQSVQSCWLGRSAHVCRCPSAQPSNPFVCRKPLLKRCYPSKRRSTKKLSSDARADGAAPEVLAQRSQLVAT